jgi:hypothetical protein
MLPSAVINKDWLRKREISMRKLLEWMLTEGKKYSGAN